MESEKLKIFDDNRNQIGVASREEVHRVGYWHEVFHCWFVGKEKDTDYIYLQLRSEVKKDYPGLFDITAAGHLLAEESVMDGVREVREELGIDVSFHELEPLGVINYRVFNGNFIDKEIANIFLYKMSGGFEDFKLQEDEVSGIIKVKFDDFDDFWLGGKETIHIEGFKMDEESNKIHIDQMAGKNQFVTHQNSYYETVIQRIAQKLNSK
ncbi:NUDIX hydrolase [Neobacillus citreus]|uniref:NUDIX domain-containing protein n=1 Tax=Neobacillus citreus TaxID=2833578 RepID=A0A942YDP6_9BACI|nr:NUDIX domain-containing protein [Neobacillus citreus]MCH6269530.1 NUDIX domain-containing protein [Neobacillus citreus]